MTIGKKLYIGFGSILVILVALFVVNIVAGLREQSARSDASTALQSVRTIESVRYQIMLNRNNLNNFLLSGDPRDEDKVNHGLDRHQRPDQARRIADEQRHLRTALIQVESTEASWGDNFAKPLAGQAPSGRFRRRYRLRPADFLPSEGSDFLADEIFGRSGSDQRGHHEVAR